MNRKKTLFFNIILLLIVGVFFFHIKNVKAIEYGGFGGRPANPDPNNPRTASIFTYELQPGAEKEDAILVINNDSEQLKNLKIYSTDYALSSNGAFSCKQISDNNHQVGTWINLEKTEVTLEPGTQEKVSFKIYVPKQAEVGEHNGCIVIQENKPKELNKSTQANISMRTAIRVAVTIPGEINRKLELQKISVIPQNNKGLLVQAEAYNSGNVSIDAAVEAETDNFFGNKYSLNKGVFSIMAGEKAVWNFKMPKPTFGGWYHSQYRIKYDNSKNTILGEKNNITFKEIDSRVVWFFSWPTLKGMIIEGLFVLVLIIIVLLLILHWKQRQWIKKFWIEYSIQPKDTLKNIAKKNKTSWKLIAKVNNIKAPYVLRKNGKIRVPPKKSAISLEK